MSSREQAALARTGSRVAGKYELRRVLGQGGMGTVYAAEHAFTGRAVAVKLLHAELAENASLAERFLREARAASAIHHPGIVEVLDAGLEPDGTLYLVLELLDGEDLASAIDHQRIDALGIVRVARELLGALTAAHARGIVHRDLKPENVFLCTDGRVKLLDFGIAKQLSRGDDLRLTATGAVLGTPYYMSPEQARGMEVDARTDLWSLGAVLFHALTGRPPFEGQSYNALLAAILTEEPPRLAALRPDVPAALAAVIDRALVRDRAARWQTADEMVAALDAVLGHATAQVQLRAVALSSTRAPDGESGVRTPQASSSQDGPPLSAVALSAARTADVASAATLSATPTGAVATGRKGPPWVAIVLGAVAVVGLLVVGAILLSGALLGRAIAGDGETATPPGPPAVHAATPATPIVPLVPAVPPAPPTPPVAQVPVAQVPVAQVPVAPPATGTDTARPRDRHLRPHAQPVGATDPPAEPRRTHHALDPVRTYEE